MKRTREIGRLDSMREECCIKSNEDTRTNEREGCKGGGGKVRMEGVRKEGREGERCV